MNCSIAEMGFPANGPPYVIPLDQVQELCVCIIYLYAKTVVDYHETASIEVFRRSFSN